jgi:hypothetical protein
MESGPFLPVVDYGEREFEFRPLATVTTAEQITAEPIDTSRLNFIGGSFGRTVDSDMRAASAPAKEIVSPRARWGVGYIAGVGPTELVDESPPVEMIGALPVYQQVSLQASRDFRGLASLALATMILMIVGVALFVTTGSTRATVQTSVKAAPPVQHAPSTQAPSSLPYIPDTEPHSVAPAAGPVNHYVPATRTVPPPPAAPASAPVAQPPSPPDSGNTDHHGHGAMNVWHHHGSALDSSDEGH